MARTRYLVRLPGDQYIAAFVRYRVRNMSLHKALRTTPYAIEAQRLSYNVALAVANANNGHLVAL